jgi:hypothetical protein
MRKGLSKPGYIFSVVALLLLSLNACNGSGLNQTPSVEISDVRVQEAEAVRSVVSTEEFVLLNCDGTGELSQTVERNVTPGERVSVGATSIGAEIGIHEAMNAKLEAAVELTYGQPHHSIELSAAPGTHIVYVIEWEEQRFSSIVSFVLDDEVYEAPYTYRIWIPKIRSSYHMDCPTLTSTPTSTLTETPKPSPTPTSTLIRSLLLEDFEDARRMNWWTPDSDVFEYGETNELAYGGDWSLRIKYDKTDAQQYIGADPVTPELSDFRGAQALQVWVYGKVTILLKLENADAPITEVNIGEQSATDPNDWTLLTYDLIGIDEQMDLSNVKMLFFLAPRDPSESGVIYFDDISLLLTRRLTPTPTPTPRVYPPPVLSGVDIFGCNVTLRWSWPRVLAEYEFFSVRLGIGAPRSVLWTKGSQHTINLSEAGEYSWEVVVCRGDSAANVCEPLVTSERGSFAFGGCSTPFPPTPTRKLPPPSTATPPPPP